MALTSVSQLQHPALRVFMPTNSVMTSSNLLVLFVSFSTACLVLSIYKINQTAQ